MFYPMLNWNGAGQCVLGHRDGWMFFFLFDFLINTLDPPFASRPSVESVDESSLYTIPGPVAPTAL